MKRLLPLIPIFLLFLVNSCTPSMSIEEMGTAVALSQTAESWTLTPTQTSNPALSDMRSWITADLSNASPLGWIMDAQYYVNDVTIQNVPRKPDLIARVDVDCVCMNNTDCCIPERVFVLIVESMRRNKDKVPFQMFSGISDFVVVCYDNPTKKQVGAMSASWQHVQGYLLNPAEGYHLGEHAIHTTIP
jgi:hypothetical protein